jgi:hypothetical protein
VTAVAPDGDLTPGLEVALESRRGTGSAVQVRARLFDI